MTIHLLKNNKIYNKVGSRSNFSKTKCNRLLNSVSRFDRLTADSNKVTCKGCLRFVVSKEEKMKPISMSDEILTVLDLNPGLFQHEIVTACGRTSNNRSTVCSALWRLKARDKIKQKGGLYFTVEVN